MMGQKIINVMSLIFLFLFAWSLEAAKPNKEAPRGGSIVMNLRVGPTTIHPITSTDAYSSQVHAYTLDSLLTRDPQTFEWKPRLAERWETSKDSMIFTFYLRKDLKFHDGKPMTAEDVKFSFDAIFEPKY